MNLLDVSEMLKGAPDDYLRQHVQTPDGTVPQFLALSELQRRTDMRARFAQPDPTPTTVMQDVLARAGGSQGGNVPAGSPNGMAQGVGIAQGGPPPGGGGISQGPAAGYANGGIVGYADGGYLSPKDMYNGYDPDEIRRRIYAIEGRADRSQWSDPNADGDYDEPYNPDNPKETSSAKGAGQFIESTWKRLNKKTGGDVNDWSPRNQDRAMKTLMDEGVSALQRHGHDVTPANVYLAHLMGEDKAAKFLDNLRDNPDASIRSMYGDKTRKINKGFFGDPDKEAEASGPSAPTLREVKDRIEKKVAYYPRVHGAGHNIDTASDPATYDMTRSVGGDMLKWNYNGPTEEVDNRTLPQWLAHNILGVRPAWGGEAQASAGGIAAQPVAGDRPPIKFGPGSDPNQIVHMDAVSAPFSGMVRGAYTGSGLETMGNFIDAAQRMDNPLDVGDWQGRMNRAIAEDTGNAFNEAGDILTGGWSEDSSIASNLLSTIPRALGAAVPAVAGLAEGSTLGILGPIDYLFGSERPASGGQPSGIATNAPGQFARPDLTTPMGGPAGDGITVRAPQFEEIASESVQALTAPPTPETMAQADTAAANLAKIYDQMAADKGDARDMAMLNAGFAMMAGDSPFAGVNIGKGGMAGVDTYNNMMKQSAGIADSKSRLALAGQELALNQRKQSFDEKVSVEKLGYEKQRAQAYADRAIRTGRASPAYVKSLLKEHEQLGDVLAKGASIDQKRDRTRYESIQMQLMTLGGGEDDDGVDVTGQE